MAHIQKTVLLTHAAEAMFDLVFNVEAYPTFLPWCGGGSKVALNDHSVAATVVIAFKGLQQEFTTINSYERPREIRMQLKSGPFRALRGHWQFHALREDACRVSFELEYEFSSKILEKLIGPVFQRITETFVDGFVKQADVLKRQREQREGQGSPAQGIQQSALSKLASKPDVPGHS